MSRMTCLRQFNNTEVKSNPTKAKTQQRASLAKVKIRKQFIQIFAPFCQLHAVDKLYFYFETRPNKLAILGIFTVFFLQLLYHTFNSWRALAYKATNITRISIAAYYPAESNKAVRVEFFTVSTRFTSSSLRASWAKHGIMRRAYK